MTREGISETALLRAVGAYLRGVPAPELPGRLRSLRGFTPRGLARHRDTILSALDDEALRARMGEWLDEKPSLSKPDAADLRAALAAGEAWREVVASAPAEPAETGAMVASVPAETVTKERERARRAREDLRKAREDARREVEQERAQRVEAERRVGELEERVVHLEARTHDAESETRRATAALERERRKARSDLDKQRERLEELRTQLREARAEARSLERTVADLRRESRNALDEQPLDAPADLRPSTRRRRPLRVPKGLLQEDPETLHRWLTERDDVSLLIDGYNVTLAEGGFRALELEAQRERLVQEAERVARRYGVRAVVVFDGSQVAPATYRRPRGPVEVQYSRPPEKADDHLVALAGDLPSDPVVAVTNDRELQTRLAEHGVTIARTDQFLALVR